MEMTTEEERKIGAATCKSEEPRTAADEGYPRDSGVTTTLMITMTGKSLNRPPPNLVGCVIN